jgi:hypothetical protein
MSDLPHEPSGPDEDPSKTRPPLPAYRPPPDPPATSTDPMLLAEARKRLEQKANFRKHLTVYWLVMTLLVGIWLVSGGWSSYFWPIWPGMAWGLGLALHFVSLGWDSSPTDEQIAEEARRIATRRGQQPGRGTDALEG